MKKFFVKCLTMCLIFVLGVSVVGCSKQSNEEPLVKSCAIEYVLNGGVNDERNKSVVSENEVIALNTPTKYGYTFLGWTTEDGTMVEELAYSTNSIKVFANWEINSECFLNLPLIQINTENCKFPENKTDYISCAFKLTNTDSDKYNMVLDMGSAGIRLRGNSTQGMAKKPFRIKFNKKQSLFGYEKNKSWVLLADYIDQSNIRNYTAFKIANSIDGAFSPHGTHVVLYINDSYQGIYLLTEQIDENKGRTAVKSDIDASQDTNFPFLVEMDRNALYEGVTGVDNFSLENLWYPMEIKYPEFDERGVSKENDNVFAYIKEYMWAVFYTLKTGESVEVSFSDSPMFFEDLVDEDSYLNYVLINEIMGNRDNAWGSIYMSKTKDGKLKFGPVWDFDWSVCGGFTGLPYQEICVNYANNFVLIKDYNFHGAYLINEARYNKLINKFNEIKPKVVEIVKSLINYYDKIYSASAIDATYWYGDNGTYMFGSQFCAVRLFLLDKLDYMSSKFDLSFSDFKLDVLGSN